MIKVIMPKLGLTMKDATIVRWLKAEGETVEKGEPLLEIETEKIATEVEAPASGVLRKILAPEGSIVPVIELIAIISEPGEELPAPEQIIEDAERRVVTPVVEVEKPALNVAEEKVRISPLAAKLAEEHKIDITKIKGTGPSGRIVKEDVLRAIEKAKAVPVVQPTEALRIAQVIPLTGMRKTTAERLSRSYREAVHVPMTIEVDMTETMNFRQKLLPEVEEKAKISLSYTDILVKAVAVALKKNPIINSMLEGNQIKIIKDINIGVAVAVEDGLIVPVVRSADEKSPVEIALCLRDLTERARQHRLSPDDVSGGTFTISNLGMFAVDTFTPIINPPQGAILGVGVIKDKPVVINGQIAIRQLMTLTLVFDHRVFDGVPAAVFLKMLKEILENPSAYIE
jgi:pyruvate dehydrogenase E2 component (dihydrolipoamide acetyltransferase)